MRNRLVAFALVVALLIPILVGLGAIEASAQEATRTPVRSLAPKATPLPTNGLVRTTGQTVLTITPTITLIFTLTNTVFTSTPVSIATEVSPTETAIPSPTPTLALEPSATPTEIATVAPAAIEIGFLGDAARPSSDNLVIQAGIGAAIIGVGILLIGALTFLVRRSRTQKGQNATGQKALKGSGKSEPGQKPFVPYLLGVADPSVRFDLKGDRLSFGRGGHNDLVVPSHAHGAQSVSAKHARLERRGARWIVIDGIEDGKLSANGVTVNGKRTLENYISDQDEIGFGQFVVRFYAQSPVPQASEGGET